MRKALNVTPSITKSSSGKVKLQLSNLTPKTVSVLLLSGKAGFFSEMTILKEG